MAKKKAPGTKTQAIGDYLAKHPNATASEVVPALAKEGINTSQQLVGKIRTRLKKASNIKKTAVKTRPGKKKTARRKAVPKPKAASLTAEDLFAAKKLVDTLGGLAEARKALETLERLR